MERVTAMGEEDIRQPYGNYLDVFPVYPYDRGTGKRRQEGRKLFLTQLQEAKSQALRRYFAGTL